MLIIKLVKYLSCIFLPLLSTSVYADLTLFDVSPTDQSLQYLGMIFGGSVGSITLGGQVPNPILGLMFEKLNGIVLAVSTLVVSYVGILSTINTAHEGEVMGKKFSSIWIPMKSICGMLLMVPSTGNGYSLVQMLVMWVVLQGIGAANTVWNVVLTQLNSGISVTGAAATPVAVCMKALNWWTANGMLPSNNILPNKSSVITGYTTGSGNSFLGTANGAFNVGVNNGPGASPTICGTYPINITGDWTASDSLTINLSAIAAVFQSLDAEASVIFLNYVQDAGMINTGTSYDIPGFFQLAQDAYNNQAINLLGLKLTALSGVNTNDIYQNASYVGWIHAGSFYNQLTQPTSNTLGAIKPVGYSALLFTMPTATTAATIATSGPSPGPSFLTQPQINLLNQAFSAISTSVTSTQASTKNVIQINMGAFSTSPDMQTVAFIGEIIQDVANTIISGLHDVLAMDAFNSANPLHEIANFGAMMMEKAEQAWIAQFAGQFVLMFFTAGCQAINPLAATLGTFLSGVLMAITGLYMLCWGMGAGLAIYLPMIPYIIFLTTSISWLVSVIEAVVAAPLMALSLVLPSQEELGNLKHGMNILLTVFFKPVLMIFGLVLASRFIQAGIALINFSFSATVSKLIPQGATVGIFSWALPPLLYFSLVLAFINQCFNLIYLVPDKALRWMGVQSEATDMSMAKETKESYSKKEEQVGKADKAFKGEATAAAGKAGDAAGQKVGKK